jgi:hypothetical protein
MSKSGIHDVQNVFENSVKVTILNKNTQPSLSERPPNVTITYYTSNAKVYRFLMSWPVLDEIKSNS